jgi:hypothetical protein
VKHTNKDTKQKYVIESIEYDSTGICIFFTDGTLISYGDVFKNGKSIIEIYTSNLETTIDVLGPQKDYSERDAILSISEKNSNIKYISSYFSSVTGYDIDEDEDENENEY